MTENIALDRIMEAIGATGITCLMVQAKGTISYDI